MRLFTRHCLQLIALFSFAFIACTNNKQAANTNSDSLKNETIPMYLPPNTTSANGDTLIVYRKAAVFYEPDSSQIAKRRQAVGEDDFNAGIEDYAYNLNAAHDFLYSTKLPQLDAKGRKFITFISINKSEQTIRIDTSSELWGVYFFDPARKAKQVDMTMIEEEYKSYFK
jgi:hypothetical protein